MRITRIRMSVWAPSIRFHDGWYYIYWGDPDFGVYMVKTQDPAGKWEAPVCVIKGQGYIDTCPLWDSDEFNAPTLGKQWQWQANYDEKFGTATAFGTYRLEPRRKEVPDVWR